MPGKRKSGRDRFRPLRTGLVLVIWLAASGTCWDLLQVYAWGQMWVHNLQSQGAAAALATTFSEEGRCGLCKTVQAAREDPREESSLLAHPGMKVPLLPVPQADRALEERAPGMAAYPPEKAGFWADVRLRPPVPPPRAV